MKMQGSCQNVGHIKKFHPLKYFVNGLGEEGYEDICTKNYEVKKRLGKRNINYMSKN